MIFSQSGIFRLQKLASQFYSVTGTRHKLSNPDEVMDLLRSSTHSNDEAIQIYLTAFTNELDSEQRRSLAAQGVLRH